jgi:hypothetical protein
MTPRVPVLGKAMAENDWVTFAGFHHMHPDTVRANELVNEFAHWITVIGIIRNYACTIDLACFQLTIIENIGYIVFKCF